MTAWTRPTIAAILIATAMMAGVALRATPLAAADRKFVEVGTFSNEGAKLVLGHFTLREVGKPQQKVGVIAIAAPNDNSFAFDYDEWLEFIDLTDKAVGSTSYRIVGVMKETGTTDTSELEVSGGPDLHLMIVSPKAGLARYAMDKADVVRFQKGLRQVRDYLAK
jgi:hypothetical protein